MLFCVVCDKELTGKQKKYCSKECCEEGKKRGGKYAPNWRGGGITIKCQYCGISFEIKKSDVGKKKFCSRKCYSKWQSEHTSGENSPCWKPKQKMLCKNCGIDFEIEQWKIDEGRQFCSRKCSSEFRTGKNHPAWKDRIIINCSYCGQEIEKKQWQIESGNGHFFCNHECQYKWMSETFVGENHPRFNSLEKECLFCKKPFLVPSGLLESQKFCSKECHMSWTIETGARSGENHPNWKGGISGEGYVGFTEKLKSEIRHRDDNTCQICGKYGHQVHHIDYNKKNPDESNLITLCISCHMKTNYNRVFWEILLSTRKFHNDVYKNINVINLSTVDKGTYAKTTSRRKPQKLYEQVYT